MNQVIIFLAQYLIYLLTAWAIVAGWVTASSRRSFIWWIVKLAVVFGLAYLSVKLLGSLVPESRPFVAGNFQPLIPHASDNSFPSDHATIAGFLATVLWQMRRSWGYLAFGLAILIGVGRVLAGVHYWQDVTAGLVIGTAIALAVFKLWPRKLD